MDMHWTTPGDVGFYLLALNILLALIAAVGAWRSPRTLTRDEAEDLFAAAHERTSAETQRLREVVVELQRSSGSQLQAFRSDTQEQLGHTRELVERQLGMLQPTLESTVGQLRTTLSAATEQQEESLRRNLGDLSTNVTQALTEARRSQDEGIGKVEDTLQQVRADVDRASNEVKTSIVELQRQHNEAKAQSAIQLCEALISSLGTLRNTIAAQIADPRAAQELLTNVECPPEQIFGEGATGAPDSPEGVDNVPPENQVAPS
jgi:hypothetical protein